MKGARREVGEKALLGLILALQGDQSADGAALHGGAIRGRGRGRGAEIEGGQRLVLALQRLEGEGARAATS